MACGRSGKVTEVKPRAALRSISADRQLGVGQIGDPERHDPLGMRRVPLFEEPVVPGAHAGQPEVTVRAREEDTAAEAGDLRGEVDRGPDAVDVHVAHPGLDVVAAGPHLVEAEGLEAVTSRAGGRPRRSCRPGCSAHPRTPRPGAPARFRRCAAPSTPGRPAGAPRRCGRAPRRGRPPRSPCSAPPEARGRGGRGPQPPPRSGVCPRIDGAPTVPALRCAPRRSPQVDTGLKPGKGGGVIALVVVSTFVVLVLGILVAGLLRSPRRHPPLAARAGRRRGRPRPGRGDGRHGQPGRGDRRPGAAGLAGHRRRAARRSGPRRRWPA